MTSKDTGACTGKIESFHVAKARDRFEVCAQINVMGSDLQVNLFGGRIHIGAIGIGEPRPGLKDPGRTSATGSVFTFARHKEDVIVKPMAQELAARLNRKVVVVAGMHWGGLDRDGIEAILSICREITEKIVETMEAA